MLKEEGSAEISQFWAISLLSVESKIFFSVFARQMAPYMMENGYIETPIQKAEIPGFSQCLEHTTILSHLTQEAKRN